MLKFLTDLFKPEAPKAPPITSETSMNFDAENVGPFLTRLANNPRFGLPEGFAASIAQALPDMNVDDTRRWRIDGAFDGAMMQLEVQVFMDDLAAPDLSFFGTRAAIAEIDRDLSLFDAAMED